MIMRMALTADESVFSNLLKSTDHSSPLTMSHVRGQNELGVRQQASNHMDTLLDGYRAYALS